MIKARVLSTTMSAKPDAPIEVNMEMWIFNGSLSCPDEVIIIMTEEEYKALDSVSDVLRKSLLDEREKTRKLREEDESLRKRLNEKDGEIYKLTVNNDCEQLRLREKIKKLEEENEAIQKDIKDLEEKMAQEAAEVDLCPDGTIVFKKKRVSELEKKVKELEEKNKYLKKRLMTRYTVNFDADGAIIYPESKED